MARSVTRSVDGEHDALLLVGLETGERRRSESYVPAEQVREDERPSAPVTASRAAFVPAFVTVTVTPG